LDTGAEHRVDRVGVTQAATGLNRHAALGCDSPHRLEVDRPALARAVEVDDMEEAGALPDPAAGGLEGVGVVAGLALEVALDQPHRPAAADVDRRVEDHAAVATAAQTLEKFESSRRPAAL